MAGGIVVDAISLELGRRAQACIGGGDGHVDKGRQNLGCAVDQLALYVWCGGGEVAARRFLGGEADQGVAEYGRRQVHALGPGVGDGQDDRVKQSGSGLVKHHELALARFDGEIGTAQKCSSIRSP